jgi:hypothetical protein
MNCGVKTTFFAQSIPNSVEVEESARDAVKFSNGLAIYSDYEIGYSADYDNVNDDNIAKTWRERKYWAIPNIAICILKAFGHIMAAIVFCRRVRSFDSIKAFSFCVIRDVEELYGNLIIIFNDKLGLYHIQKAQFQKYCYHEYDNAPRWRDFINNADKSNEYYETLELTRNASVANIKKNYIKLSLKYHPDKSIQDDEESYEDFKLRQELNEEKFKDISTAYEGLLAFKGVKK